VQAIRRINLFAIISRKLSIEQKPQVCDATKDQSENKSRAHKKSKTKTQNTELRTQNLEHTEHRGQNSEVRTQNLEHRTQNLKTFFPGIIVG
jgi:hypothetical protein